MTGYVIYKKYEPNGIRLYYSDTIGWTNIKSNVEVYESMSQADFQANHLQKSIDEPIRVIAFEEIS